MPPAPSLRNSVVSFFFFFNDTATTEIYTLSLHDALPISPPPPTPIWSPRSSRRTPMSEDRKSTRLNSSHVEISYAVFCLKKKKHNIGGRHNTVLAFYQTRGVRHTCER